MIRVRVVNYDAVPIGKMSGYVYDAWAWGFLTAFLVVEHGLNLDEARDVVTLLREVSMREAAA